MLNIQATVVRATVNVADADTLGACRELAPSKQESTTYKPSRVCKLLILGCRLLIPDRLLVQQGRRGTPNAVLLVVFAIELMLKVFLAHEGKKIKKTHTLGELFGELNDDTRSSIQMAALGHRFFNVRSLLKQNENAFMDWRYGILEEGATASIPYDQFRWTYDALIEVWSKTHTG